MTNEPKKIGSWVFRLNGKEREKMKRIYLGRKEIVELPLGQKAETVKHIVYDNVKGFTFEFHEEAETCTKNEMCLVVHYEWHDGVLSTATYPISTISYITIEDEEELHAENKCKQRKN